MASCLIITADAGARTRASEVLSGCGHLVSLAAGPDEGLKLLAGTPVDVVIIDAEIHGASGSPLAEELLQDELDLGVVVTSRTDPSAGPGWLRRGAGDHLVGPGSGEALRNSVERCLDRLRLRRQRDGLARRLREQADETQGLVTLAGRLDLDQPLEAGLDAFLAEVVTRHGARGGVVWLVEASSDSLVCRAACHLSEVASDQRLERNRGFLWECMESAAALSRSFEGSGPEACDADWAGAARNAMAAPLLCRGRSLGVLALVDLDGVPAREEPRRLQAMAGILALALHFAQAGQDLRHSRQELMRLAGELETSIGDRTRACQASDEGRRVALLELERSHQVLHRAKAVAADRDRMVMLGQLAAGLAHEINNPLAFVCSNLESLERIMRELRGVASRSLYLRAPAADPGGSLRDLLVPGEGRARLQEAVDEVAPLFDEMRAGLIRITEAVAALRCFAEDVDQEGKTTEVDLNQEVQRVLLLLQGSGLRFLPIETQLGALPTLSLPVLGLRQLLLDLLGRLLRFAKGPGGLRVTTSRREPGVCLEVEDREGALGGVEVPALFEPEPAQPARTRNHLHLLSCREAAGRLGGLLSAEPLPPKGLCVRLLWPACHEEQA